MLCAGNKCYRVLNASANFSSAIGFCRELLGNPKKKAFLTSSTDAFENGTTTVQYVCGNLRVRPQPSRHFLSPPLLAAFVMSQLRLAGLRSKYVWTGLWNRMEQGMCDLQWQSNGTH